MMKDHGGSIINIGSGANKVAFPKLVDYGASKDGIDNLTKNNSWAPKNRRSRQGSSP